MSLVLVRFWAPVFKLIELCSKSFLYFTYANKRSLANGWIINRSGRYIMQEMPIPWVGATYLHKNNSFIETDP